MNSAQKARYWALDYVYAVYLQASGFLERGIPNGTERADGTVTVDGTGASNGADPSKASEATGSSERPGTPDAPVDTRPPIVLLPGVYENWYFLRPVAALMRSLGYPVHVVPELGRNTKSFADSAAVVATYLSDHDLRDVSIIAHSKGGLIGKYLMVRHDPENRVRRMVAVASPFSGSLYARYIPMRSLRVFSPRDATLLMLTANLASNARITSIYGVFDPHIPGGSKLDGATNIVLDVAGHFRILGSPLLHAELRRIFGADPA